jgi:Tfp pilus assembly protein PilF
MAESKKLERLKALVGVNAALRNNAKIIDFSNRALKISRDPEMQVQLAQAYYQSGNNKEAVRVMKELLGSLEQSGRVAKENQLLLIVTACQKAGDNACQKQVFEKLVVNYPKTEYWQNLMVALRTGDNNDVQTLNVMRLSNHVKVMKKPDEYKEFAQLSLDEKLSCEAQAVLEDGFAKKIFVDKRDVDVNTRLLNTAKTRCIAEKAAVAPAENAANQQPTGDALVKAGAQYLVGGNPAKAAEVIQKGIAKNSLAKGDQYEAQRVDEANILLGIAHLKNNNKPEAQKAFRAVKRDPTMVSIAKFWLLSL